MNTSSEKHELPLINRYYQRGYTDSYRIVKGKLKNLTNGDTFQPEDVFIEETKRFEGMSNPADMSILYVIHTSKGCKGVILAPYGPVADGEMIWFMKNAVDETKK